MDRIVACLKRGVIMWKRKNKKIITYLTKEKKRKEKKRKEKKREQKEKLYDLFYDVNLEPEARERM